MDVINVVSVAMKATVHQWIESDDEEVQAALYWRQAYNCRTAQLSVSATRRLNDAQTPSTDLSSEYAVGRTDLQMPDARESGQNIDRLHEPGLWLVASP